MKKKILIIIGIVIIVVVILMATRVLKFSANISPIDEGPAPAAQVVPEGWSKYTSGEFGYSILYPKNWNLKDNNNETSREILIVAPESKAFVRVVAFKDPSLTSVATVEGSIAEYKASFDEKPNETLKEFTSEINGEIGGFLASGLMQVDALVYQFLEKGLLATNGNVLVMRGAAKTGVPEFEELGKIVKQILDSFVL